MMRKRDSCKGPNWRAGPSFALAPLFRFPQQRARFGNFTLPYLIHAWIHSMDGSSSRLPEAWKEKPKADVTSPCMERHANCIRTQPLP